ncbi:hypothetical protein BBBOND_0312580 [Babesia bigemina]|uniref:C3H1-type domain-containing protein n=1 Tax=Babesia bigemina TaxID=5866 RepID=A0A061DEI8_BABBI|nr:hypothetical protein BBBOND_0312580 [Babesia bigemina]CDR97355.1 hypothetical protein BBBOND_0312580 [Babesia bigemina]|eukprot:XP_012769541.1 hypothetical protein BBBOND_0312580 [Babesia bigemina]
MAPQFKKLTDCPENLRESIDWLIQVKSGGGLDDLCNALKILIRDAIESAKASLKGTDEDGFTSCKKCSKKISPKLLDPADSCVCPEHKQVEDLEKQLKEFIGQQEGDYNINEILENLCTCLETFLGFNSESKGYDGEGIVYSDLDRLCDAVMAFLYGVLSNIQSHLGQHNGQITDAITLLKQNKHLGKNGFNDAIEKVVAGVRGYNEKVKRSNGNVRSITSKLLQYVTHGGDFNRDFNGIRVDDVAGSPEVKDAQVTKVEKLVKECRQNAREFGKNIRRADKDVADLNPQLRQNIERVKINIAHESKKLEDIHAKQQRGLEATEKIIKETLHGLNCNVNEKIKIDVEKLVADLKEKISVILKNLESINEKLKECINDLTDWITKADSVVEESYKLVQEILNALKDDNSNTNPYKIQDVAEKLKVEAGVLHGQFDMAKSEYEKLFNLIKGKDGDGEDEDCVIKKLNEVHMNVEKLVPERDLISFNTLDGDWGLKNQINPLIQKIKDNVKEYLESLRAALKEGIAVIGRQYGSGGAVIPGSNPAVEALVSKMGQSTELKPLGGRLETVRDDKSGQGFALEKALKHLHDAKEELTPSTNLLEHMYENLKSSLQDKAVAVDSELCNLIYGACINGISELQEAVTAIVNEKLEPLKDEVSKFIKQAEESKQGVIDYAQNVTKHLRALSDDIMKALTTDDEKEVNDRLRGRLNDLKQKISKDKPNITDSLQDLQRRLDKLHGDVKAGPITKLKHLLNTYADHVRDKYVKQTQEQVNQQVKRAVYTITQQARKQYVSFVSDMLTLFSTKVAEELTGLPQEMDHELVIGFHGFMHRFEYTFNPNFSGYAANPPETLHDLSSKFSHSINYFVQELKTQTNLDADVARLSSPFSAVSRLFNDLNTSHHFDHTFSQNISDLISKLEHCAPKQFGDPSNAMLDVLKFGLHGLARELSKAYVSVYDGAHPINQWVDEKRVLTTEGKHGAKVCITILEMLFKDLNDLRNKCKEGSECKYKTICARNGTVENPLGAFLGRCGYIVSEEDKQNGELRYKNDFTGQHIRKDLLTKIHGIGDAQYKLVSDDDEKEEIKVDGEERVITANPPDHGVLRTLLGYLHDYYRVCHYASSGSKKSPRNIYDMLIWLSGLPHNPVYHELTFSSFDELFDKSEEKNVNVDGTVLSLAYIDDVSFVAYPETMKVSQLTSALGDVCSKSHSVLTAIVGHGHSDGVYACDYNTNESKLQYPSSASACFDMLVDILYRVYHQLNFLYNQCCDTTDVSGWRNCWYGNAIGGSSWKCNKLQCPDQLGNPTCNPTCRQHPNCGIKSPLQSFLEDGLPGFLPHQFEKPGCKLECTVSNHRGLPCKTPMGFSDIATTASHRQSGRYLCTVLADFCGGKDSCLTEICSSLICLLNRPPQTLDEMFAFYYHLLNEWNSKSGAHEAAKKHKKYAFEVAVKKASFGFYDHLDNTTIFKSINHEAHTKGDLFSLVCSNMADVKCGKYIKPLSHNIWTVFSQKHASRYLSWVVYLTETFHNLLDRLLNECIATCGEGNKCYVKCCAATCPVKSAYASKTPIIGLIDKHHTQDCKSITHCPSTRPTLSKYGLVFRSPYDLSGINNVESKRTCRDFCYALETVLNKEVHLERALAKFVFETIPEFLFRIREPFIWTVVALWSMSLLYLFYVSIGRLDTLHIRSHLRSLSSHKIAAQSLLAAARVGKLSKISYLQA